MCLEDLRLARGQEIGTVTTAPDAAIGAQFLPANPNRVAVIISCPTATLGSIVSISLDQAQTKKILSLSDAVPIPFVMRIYDFGQALTAALFSGGTAAGTNWNVVEIISYVNAKPFARIEDRNKV